MNTKRNTIALASLLLTLLATVLAPSIAHADDATWSSQCMAVSISARTTTFPLNHALDHVEAYLGCRHVTTGSNYLELSATCYPDSFGYFSSDCQSAGYLGNCSKTVQTVDYADFDGVTHHWVTSSCTNPHTGRCSVLAGDVTEGGELRLVTRQNASGCQY